MKRRSLKKLMALLAVTSLAAGLAGCAKGGEEGSKAEKKESAGVNIAMKTDPDNLDASRADDSQKNQIILEVQETLVRFDENGEMQPAGAKSYDISDDGMVYTFHLTDNQYSDGSDVKAEDYANCMLRTLEPEVGSHDAGTFYVIEGAEEFNKGEAKKEDVGVKALDDHTLEITLKEPIPYFIQMVNTSKLTPIPLKDTEGDANITYGTDAEKMVYSGPFMIDKWQRGSGIELKKNPNYWDAANVKLEHINFKLVQEENTRQQMFEQGDISVLEEINAEYYDKVKADIEEGRTQLVELSKPSNSYISFNNQDPEGVFTNAKIRKAFSLAIDRELYVEKVLRKDMAAFGNIPPATNNGETKYRDDVEEPLKGVSEDPGELFKEGLKEIGKEGEKLTVTFLQGNANNDTKVKSEFFQNQWESKLGVTVKIDTAADSATFNNAVSKGLYQICNTGWGADYNDPMTFMQMYTKGDGNNAPFVSNDKFDELVTACKTELDMSVREAKFQEAEKILIAEEACIAPLIYGQAKNLIADELKGVSFNGAGGPSIELKTAYKE